MEVVTASPVNMLFYRVIDLRDSLYPPDSLYPFTFAELDRQLYLTCVFFCSSLRLCWCVSNNCPIFHLAGPFVPVCPVRFGCSCSLFLRVLLVSCVLFVL